MKTSMLLTKLLVIAGTCYAVPQPLVNVQSDPVIATKTTNEADSVLIRHKRQDTVESSEGDGASLDVPQGGVSLENPPPLLPDDSPQALTPPPLPKDIPPKPPTPPQTPEPPTPAAPPKPVPQQTPAPQAEEPAERQLSTGENEEACDFGSIPDVTLCEWTSLNVTQLQWIPSAGQNAFWLGGPQDDVSYGDKLGGYAMFETSQIPERTAGSPSMESAMLMSPVRGSTGASGMCVKFWYAIAGLSPDLIRVLLHPMPEDMKNSDSVDEMMMGYDGSDDVVLWEARDMTMGEWKEGQVVYTFDKPHSVIFEGIPAESSTLSRSFRGYIAVDELVFAESAQCGGFCTFEGSTCGWTQDTDDDFEWSQSRGSLNPSTGPPRDRSSFTNNGMMGGYAYIDSSYPRRPGDKARLMSQEFQGTNPDSPLCMRFWTHMYGNGIGSLRVLIYDVNTKQDKTIWEISGEAGNAWYQGQVPIASASPFKIVFEGMVGNNNLGDIAIDDISIIQGACPSAPQVAASNQGDCTFEVDECGWSNPGPRDRFDEMDWVRTVAADNRHPTRDHTMGTSQGTALQDVAAQNRGFYMSMPRGSVQRGGDRAWLVSSTMEGSADAVCVAFWYFMYEPFIDPAGPSLGSLKVYVRFENDEGLPVLQPLWSLGNHQGPNWMYGQARVQSNNDYELAFEGTWGSSRGNGYMALDDITLFTGDCSTMPEKARTVDSDCDFQRDACMWRNITTDDDFRWTTASISRRPANLPDHTFGGPIGYAYFDVFNQNARPQTLTLISPPLDKSEDGNPICLSFWFAYFGASDSTKLKVHREPYDKTAEEGQRAGTAVELWSLDALNIGTQRPEWQFGQVQVDTSDDYRISLVGMASNGGFAIDDIQSYPGECNSRPKAATAEDAAAPQPAVPGPN